MKESSPLMLFEEMAAVCTENCIMCSYFNVKADDARSKHCFEVLKL